MVNFPVSLDDDTTLFIAVNNLRTELTSSIDASTLTIPVTTTAGFPSTGFVGILTGTDITQTEAIKYTSIASTQFNASERGADGTTAVIHDAGDNVDFTIVASHHNEIKDAILELEQFVGVSGSENFLQVNTLQDAYDTGDGTIFRSSDKPVVVSGELGDSSPADLFVIGSGIYTALLAIGDPEAGPFTAIDPFAVITDTILATIGDFADVLTVSGIPVATGTLDPLVVGTIAVSDSMTVSGEPVSTGTAIFPRKGSTSFATLTVAGAGGTRSDDEPFNNRSLVRKTKVTPTATGIDSYVVEFFKDSTFAADKLEYQATGSGTFIDNDVWFHEDEDQLFQIHYKLTNNSLTDSIFTVELTAEEFS